MEKAIKNKVAKAVVPAIDVMFQALRFAFESSWFKFLKGPYFTFFICNW